jgi:diketogulonate reductase-like aldo/keto reductase
MEEKVRDYGSEKGGQSEAKVFEVLEELKAEGKIKNCGWSFQFGKEDLSGRDMVMVTVDNEIIWLQVKSSFNLSDMEKYLRRGIHYIAVEQKTPEEIKKEILGILNKARSRKRRPKVEAKVEVSI